MNYDYDVIVIGAGNSGCMAGLACADAGMKTLILEQHHIPGGVAGSFVRGRFEFEYSLHEMSGITRQPNAPIGSLFKVFERFGIKLNYRDIKDAYRLITTGDGDDNIDCTIPFGSFEKVIDAIEAYIPGSSKYTVPFFDFIMESYNGLKNLGKPGSKEYIAENCPNFYKLSTMTVTEVEDFLNIPYRIRAILEAYWCYLGVTAERLDFTLYANMLYTYIYIGAVTMKMYSHEITCTVLEKYKALGGELFLNTKVNKIIIEDGVAKGVETNLGKFYAKKIICCTNRTIAYSRLIDYKDAPERAIRQCNVRSLGGQAFVVYLGLNKSHEELGLNDYNYFIYGSGDPVKINKSMRNIEGYKSIAAICLNVANPDCTPEGTTFLSLTTMFKEDAFKDMNEENYVKVKNEMAYNLIKHFEKATKLDIMPYIEEISVATPSTLAANTDAYKGIMYGYEGLVVDSLLVRANCKEKDHPIKNLIFSGASCQNGHGYAASLRMGTVSADLAVAQIKEEYNK